MSLDYKKNNHTLLHDPRWFTVWYLDHDMVQWLFEIQLQFRCWWSMIYNQVDFNPVSLRCKGNRLMLCIMSPWNENGRYLSLDMNYNISGNRRQHCQGPIALGTPVSYMTQPGQKLIANWQPPLGKHDGTIYRSHIANLVKTIIFFAFSLYSLIIYDWIMTYLLIIYINKEHI